MFRGKGDPWLHDFINHQHFSERQGDIVFAVQGLEKSVMDGDKGLLFKRQRSFLRWRTPLFTITRSISSAICINRLMRR